MKGSRNSRNTPVDRQGRVPGSGRTDRIGREVDLHLLSGHAAAEALDRQLARFRGEMNSAIRAGEKEIIFIHGGGSGKLREALRAVVREEYPSCTCHDSSFARYGYNGATTVTIK